MKFNFLDVFSEKSSPLVFLNCVGRRYVLGALLIINVTLVADVTGATGATGLPGSAGGIGATGATGLRGPPGKALTGLSFILRS